MELKERELEAESRACQELQEMLADGVTEAGMDSELKYDNEAVELELRSRLHVMEWRLEYMRDEASSKCRILEETIESFTLERQAWSAECMRLREALQRQSPLRHST